MASSKSLLPPKIWISRTPPGGTQTNPRCLQVYILITIVGSEELSQHSCHQLELPILYIQQHLQYFLYTIWRGCPDHPHLQQLLIYFLHNVICGAVSPAKPIIYQLLSLQIQHNWQHSMRILRSSCYYWLADISFLSNRYYDLTFKITTQR